MRRTATLSTDAATLVEFLASRALGQVYAKTARQIRAALGFNDRAIRALAHEATAAGVLVCAGQAGYFMPATWEETRETYRRLRSQGLEMLERASQVEKLAAAAFDVERPAAEPIRRRRLAPRMAEPAPRADLFEAVGL